MDVLGQGSANFLCNGSGKEYSSLWAMRSYSSHLLRGGEGLTVFSQVVTQLYLEKGEQLGTSETLEMVSKVPTWHDLHVSVLSIPPPSKHKSEGWVQQVVCLLRTQPTWV